MNDDELKLYPKLIGDNAGKVRPQLPTTLPAPRTPERQEEISRNYRLGRMKYLNSLKNRDKYLDRNTNIGGVPVTNGRYGMTVEEYLAWKRRKK